jgi:hypothetical protein
LPGLNASAIFDDDDADEYGQAPGQPGKTGQVMAVAAEISVVFTN